MGNSTSGEGEEDYEEEDYAQQFDGIETLGYRVLGVQPDSPASKAGLVSFFDFIVGANQKMLLGSGVGLEEGDEYDDIDFPLLLRENLGQSVDLLVYNIKTRDQRVVQLTPSNDWDGAGLLGVTIKLDDYGGADENLIRVLEIHPDGPASQCGLIPEQDFLLGTTFCTFSSTDILARILHQHLERVVELYVYNSKTDMVRIVGLHPTYQWGDGDSMLGAGLGTGYLHKLPESCRGTIGMSVERKVQVAGGIQIEPTLEMEIEDESDGTDHQASQPHQLGRTPAQLGTSGGESCESDSLRSIPLSTPTATEQEEPVRPDPPSSLERVPVDAVPQEDSSPVPPPPPPPEQAPTIESSSDTTLQVEESGFPDAAPIVENSPPPPPPPPPPVDVPPPPPPPPPPPASKDPPEESHDDDEGSEYTDGSYTDDEDYVSE